MQFELTDQLIDEILFFMEDQNGDFYIDAREAAVLSFDDIDFDEEDPQDCIFYEIPEWQPNDGFRLMESFTAGLQNSVIKNLLSQALNRGKGVFRAFKDIISQYPEAEKLWFNYRDSKMKEAVVLWYNALREQWGLELVGTEPEETDDLVAQDFHFRQDSSADYFLAAELHRQCMDSTPNSSNADPFIFPGDFCIVAETAGAEFAAYICAVKSETGSLHVNALEVKPEYRGFGLGKSLLSQLLGKTADTDITEICIELPGEYCNFSRVLNREGFQPVITRYKKFLNRASISCFGSAPDL